MTGLGYLILKTKIVPLENNDGQTKANNLSGFINTVLNIFGNVLGNTI